MPPATPHTHKKCAIFTASVLLIAVFLGSNQGKPSQLTLPIIRPLKCHLGFIITGILGNTKVNRDQ